MFRYARAIWGFFKVGFSIETAASGTSVRNFVFDGNHISDNNRDPLASGVVTLTCADNVLIDSNPFQGGLLDIIISGNNNRITQNGFSGFTMLSDGSGGAAILELSPPYDAPGFGNSILYNQITSKVPPGDFSFASRIAEVEE